MSYNYVVTAQKPTSVSHAVTGCFTGPKHRNLIVAKCSRLEIFLLTQEGLQSVTEVPIYGRISVLNLFRPQGESKDLLWLVTEHYQMCLLEYDAATGELVTRASGNVEERIGRPTEDGQRGLVDPDARLLLLHLYDQNLKCVPVGGGRAPLLREAFNVRIDESQVLDMVFLHGTQRPTVAVLYQDQKEARHVRTYVVKEREKELDNGPWKVEHVDGGASLLIPVPAPYGGAIIIGEQSAVYVNGVHRAYPARPALGTPQRPGPRRGAGGVQHSAASRTGMVRAYGRVDADGSRYLLGDLSGRLWLLALHCDGSAVQGLKLEPLGRTSAASALAYLDSGVLYVGSASADSQLVKLNATADSSGSFVEVLETYTHLGPICGMEVVDLDRQGQCQVVTCSGVGADGSLRVVRNGIGINEQATVELPGVKGVWALRTDAASAHDAFLVVSFISETRVLAMNMEDELDETDVPGFDGGAQTLLCASVAHGQLLQVTAAGARLVSAGTLQLLASWAPAAAHAAHAVTVAAADAEHVVLALGGGHVVQLRVGVATLTEEAHTQLAHEVACADISRLQEGARPLVVVGLWNCSVAILALPGLAAVREEALGGNAIPRSVLMAAFEGIVYLLVGLGDGHLLSFCADATTVALSDRRRVSLGSQPVTLRAFSSKGAMHVFACSDRPTVIYGASRKLMFSNVNLPRGVTHMCCFNSASFPESLALASKSALTIGTIDDIQKLHIRTIPLGEQPRRIAYQEASRTFAVLCTRLVASAAAGAGAHAAGADEEEEQGSVRLLADTTFETLSAVALDPHEQGLSVCSAQFTDDGRHYFAVGTAYVLPEEPEPTRGQILVFVVENGKLTLVEKKEVKGAVWTLQPFQGKLLVSIGSKLMLYRWTQREDDQHELVSECGHHGHIIALYTAVRGDFIAVGDLMKSISLIQYKAEEGAMEERARDINAHWMTAVDVLDDDHFLGAENGYNLFVCRKNVDAASDDERVRLEVVGEFHLGEQVNVFRPGSLVMRTHEGDLAAVHAQSRLFGTASGALGVVAPLPKALFAQLARLQTAMVEVVPGWGGFPWLLWRSFRNDCRRADPRNFIDGDLLETFLDLKPARQAEVAAKAQVAVEEIIKLVEDLASLH